MGTREAAILSISLVVVFAFTYTFMLLARVAYQTAQGTRPPIRVVHMMDPKQFAALTKSAKWTSTQ
jgi:hypothetical protein